MITDNERDERTSAWLIERYGAEDVAKAETQQQAIDSIRAF